MRCSWPRQRCRIRLLLSAWCEVTQARCREPQFHAHPTIAPQLFHARPTHDVVVAGKLISKGTSGCSPIRKCSACQGDCDSDKDCKTGLKCAQRSGTEAVPGCVVGGLGDVKGYDFCHVTPTYVKIQGARCDGTTGVVYPGSTLAQVKDICSSSVWCAGVQCSDASCSGRRAFMLCKSTGGAKGRRKNYIYESKALNQWQHYNYRAAKMAKMKKACARYGGGFCTGVARAKKACARYGGGFCVGFKPRGKVPPYTRCVLTKVPIGA